MRSVAMAGFADDEVGHLKETMDMIGDGDDFHPVDIGHLTDSISPRDMGLLILFPALIVLMPLSIVPGISTLCALITLFAALHTLSGRKALWLPERVRCISFSRKRVAGFLCRVESVTEKMGVISRPRLTFMTEGLAEKLAAVAIIILAGTTVILGFLPLIDMVLMFPVALFGLGRCMQDGLVTAAGWLFLGGVASIASFFI